MLLNEANTDDDYEPMPNSYHITELVGCLRKTFYKRTQPKKPVNLEFANNFHRGKLWDKDFCRCFKHNQVRVTYRCRNIPISISGHFDFLNNDNPNAPVITDLKSPKTLFYVEKEGKPSEHYRKQVLFYCYCTAINQGAVMYWTGVKPLTFPVEVSEDSCRFLIEELEGKCLALWMALKHHRAPSLEASNPEAWECKLCDFKSKCEAEGQSQL